MDWARAKNILIFMLLALNLFLVITLFVYNSDRGASTEAEANADTILHARNITINCPIPKAVGAATRLNFVNDGYDQGTLVHELLGIPEDQISGDSLGTQFQNGDKRLEILSSISFVYTDTSPDDLVDLSRESRIEKYAVDFLKNKGLLTFSYVVDKLEANADGSITLYFIQKYGDKLIFDNKLEVTVAPGGITRIQGCYRSIRKAEAVRQETMMTARQVLLKNFTGTEATVIIGIDLGYKRNDAADNSMKAFNEGPVWRIQIDGEAKPNYYNAFNGVEIK